MARLLKIVAGSEQLFKGYSKLFILSYALFISKRKFFRCKVDTSGVSARCARRKRGTMRVALIVRVLFHVKIGATLRKRLSNA